MTERLAQFIYEQITNPVKVDYQNCYFYSETQDMNARVPGCDYYDSYGYCPCREGKPCDKRIDRKEVRKMIKDFVDNR